ncbi:MULTISPECIES: ribonuclease R [Fusobacterium]|jgi:ribonuclease R|uniref:Ribonuclease R n=1 Tax=Fusobacterium varium ATCC 27725 TaxID=469618 RepID=A0ABN5JJV3_FUSVA|nr:MULTISPECIES: ribonuclease R [Fusobacterium]AVQ30782.1 ribonuclease R [Fusobacterium varium ATCC 27725]EES64208.1 ribonuclease R [Fusobacterium varium ATCC 27725]OFL79703.1 ribonuclease R [Fusobacterium sp. HMSC073F01]RHG33302.1 ribonuclease R [Fusobacterium varium]UYI79258.1 MAG: ribonuclease R [Fusobacterium varium]
MNLDKELERLKQLMDKGKGLKLDEITKLLGWSLKNKKENREILEKWIEDGDLMRNNRGKYNIPENLGFVKGTFSIIKDRFAFVDTADEGIFIPKPHFNSALDGDTVLVKITSGLNGDKKKEGEVVKVISRERDTIVGILQRNENFGFVTPTHSFGKDIYIPYRMMKDAKNQQLVVVKITSWGTNEKKPEGEIIEVIGDPYNTNNMIEALIVREGMSETFSKPVLAEARSIATTIPKDEIAKRKDLRNLSIITIDGDDAKDLDDAVYVKKLPNGNYKLIVSIADVSYYIPEGSMLDQEAFKRGNSVYLVDRVLPMFPKEISNGICSLNPDEDKLTFTCEMEIDQNGKVVDSDTYKSVIKSVRRMTYTNVNRMIAGEEEALKEYADIKDMVMEMLELSKIIRQVKYNRGSIDFDLPEIKLVLDENGKVKYIKNRERGESERIIEDFMIAANETVAEKLFWLEIPSVYRTHEKPDPERIKNLNETLSKFKYRIHSLDEIHPKKFQKIIEDSKERGINLLVHKLILMALKQARYTVDNLGHFGLASGYYTHFTSPIRRYADLTVHRILNSVLHGYPSKKVIAKNAEELPQICTHISKTERAAMKVEDESVKIKLVEYMIDKVGEEYEATIVGFSNKRVFFETEEHVECFWDVVAAKHYYEFDDREYVMKDIDGGKIYSIGDKYKVILVRASLAELEIEVVPQVVMEEGL